MGIHSFKQPSGDYFRHLPNLASAPSASILASGVAPCLEPSHHSAPSLSLGIKKTLFVSGALTNTLSSSPQSIHPSVYLYAGPLVCLPACLPACLSVCQQPRGPRVSTLPGFDSIEPLQQQGRVHVALRTRASATQPSSTHPTSNTP